MLKPSEKQLIKRVKNGDMQAFDILLGGYRPQIQGVIARYIHNPAAIEDVLQETLIRAYKGIPRFNGDCQFFTWLYRIATNASLNYCRQHARDRKEMSIESMIAENFIQEQSQYRDENDPKNINENDEFDQAIKQGIEALPPTLQKTLYLKEIHQLSYEQIAGKMHIPSGTARSRLHRAREMVVVLALEELLHHQQDKIQRALEKMHKIKTKAILANKRQK